MVPDRDITIVAIGGNSLIDPKLTPTVENQFERTAAATQPIADRIAEGDRLVLTHGNGPQVGYMLLRSDLAADNLHPVPLDSLVADSQGALGYMIQRAIRHQLRARGDQSQLATIVTEVEVDPDDHAFSEPTKPVGSFFTAAEAETLRKESGWDMVEDANRGYRRVVPSPPPVAIIQIDTIRMLVDRGVTVIACGGGGIPVTRVTEGRLQGYEAVVDKDRASALLGVQLGAKRMIITTGVDAIYRDYLTEHPTKIKDITAGELRDLVRDGQFPAGSMGPKVEAALYFLERGGEEVSICLPEAFADACEGRAGTRIRMETK